MQKWIAVLLSLIALLMAAVLVLTAAVFHLYRTDAADAPSVSAVETASLSDPSASGPTGQAASVTGGEDAALSVPAQPDATVPSELRCSVEHGVLRLVQGDHFGLSDDSGSDCQVSWEDGVYLLSVNTTRSEPIVLTVPQGTHFQAVSLTVNGGNLSAENLCTGTLATSCQQGVLHYTGQVEGSAQVDHLQGETLLQLSGRPSDFNYELEYDLGHIAVGSQSFAGARGSHSIDNGSAKTIQIQCSMGSVEVVFPEDS